MPGGFDIVNHIADEGGLGRIEGVGGEDFADFFPLVQNFDVGLLEGVADAEAGGLGFEMGALDGAEEEGAAAGAGAEVEELAGTGKKADVVLKAGEEALVEDFQALGAGLGEEFRVEAQEREAEVGAELFERHFGTPVVAEDGVCGLNNGTEVVDQGAGPIEDDVFQKGRLTTEADFANDLRAESGLELAENFGFPRAVEFVADGGLKDLDDEDAVLHRGGLGIVGEKLADDVLPDFLDLAFIEPLGEAELREKLLEGIGGGGETLLLFRIIRKAAPL